MTSQDQITRIRVFYTKGHSLRFTGHLDLQRLWERLLRRSGLPLRYSQGFHPRARLNLASALPLGFISEAECLDFWMNEPRPMDVVCKNIRKAAPPGLIINTVQSVDLREPALQTQMMASEYAVVFFDPQSRKELLEKVRYLLTQETIIRTRRKKTYDLRPLILMLDVITNQNGEMGLWMRLKAAPGATGRPDEVLDEIGFENTEVLVKRTQLILDEDT